MHQDRASVRLLKRTHFDDASETKKSTGVVATKTQKPAVAVATADGGTDLFLAHQRGSTDSQRINARQCLDQAEHKGSGEHAGRPSCTGEGPWGSCRSWGCRWCRRSRSRSRFRFRYFQILLRGGFQSKPPRVSFEGDVLSEIAAP